jgi:hypothetical protein
MIGLELSAIEQFGFKGESKKGGREAKLEYYHRYDSFRISGETSGQDASFIWDTKGEV